MEGGDEADHWHDYCVLWPALHTIPSLILTMRNVGQSFKTRIRLGTIIDWYITVQKFSTHKSVEWTFMLYCMNAQNVSSMQSIMLHCPVITHTQRKTKHCHWSLTMPCWSSGILILKSSNLQHLQCRPIRVIWKEPGGSYGQDLVIQVFCNNYNKAVV